MKRTDHVLAYAFMLPTAVLIASLAVYPFLQAALDSLYRIDLTTRVGTFVGLANYARIAAEPEVVQAMARTGIWVVANVAAQTVLGMGIALQTLGLIGEPIGWLSSPDTAFWTVILVNCWKYTPFMVIVILARLQTVPTSLKEAARVDGASAWGCSPASRSPGCGRCSWRRCCCGPSGSPTAST